MPTSAAIRVWRGKVLPDWIDYNGHMSEGFYGLVFGMASDEYLLRIGFDEHYRATTGGAFYTVETHIVFLDELAEGTPLAVDTTVAGADRKRMHLFHELRREADATVAATQESMLLHVDTTEGRVTEMSLEVYSSLRADARAHDSILEPPIIGRAIRLVRN